MLPTNAVHELQHHHALGGSHSLLSKLCRATRYTPHPDAEPAKHEVCRSAAAQHPVRSSCAAFEIESHHSYTCSYEGLRAFDINTLPTSWML
jgi:hypothetical protein